MGSPSPLDLNGADRRYGIGHRTCITVVMVCGFATETQRTEQMYMRIRLKDVLYVSG